MARKPALVTDSEGAAGSTRASAVYEALRNDILQGVFKPSEKLRVELMGKRHGVGASPVREALSRLSAEGLVSRNEQRGFSVAPLVWDELAVLTRTRCDVESLALRDSIAQRTTDWEEALALTLHRLSRTPRSLDAKNYVPNPEWERLHSDFHQQLLAQCRSRWLRDFCSTLTVEAYRYRQVAASRNFAHRHTHEEHVAIFQAAICGAEDAAVSLLRLHYQRTSETVAATGLEAG
jgi:DNA-binding GntR family transcriptional regulator